MSITVGTNSYVTRQELIDYAAPRGVTVDDSEKADIALVNATDFLETYDSQFSGHRTDQDQDLAWPREGATIRGFEVPDDEVPALVQQTQMEIALDLLAGVDLYNREDRQIVTRERVDGAVSKSFRLLIIMRPPNVPLSSAYQPSLRGLSMLPKICLVPQHRRAFLMILSHV